MQSAQSTGQEGDDLMDNKPEVSESPQDDWPGPGTWTTGTEGGRGRK